MSQSQTPHRRHRMIFAPNELTIVHGNTFVVSDESTQIGDRGMQGIFYSDTRFVSHYRYRFNRAAPMLLTAGRVDYYSSVAHFTNPSLPLAEGVLAPNQVRLRVARQLDQATVYEDLHVTNYGTTSLALTLVVEIKSDFVDLFEARGLDIPMYGRIETVWLPEQYALVNSYINGSFSASLRYQIGAGLPRPVYANGELLFPVELAPGEAWTAAITMAMAVDQEARAEQRSPLELRSGQLESDRLHRRWHGLTTSVRVGSLEMQQIVDSADEDLASVRLYLPDLPQDVWMPAAGVPWFVTIFGRDSEIAALQTLMLYPGFASAALATLARLQGQKHDDWRLEEPGKIAHEMRFGQAARLGQTPHSPYYGTVDATPLFVILLSEVWRWTADRELVGRYLPNARAALDWCANYGDHDGDGFLDYWRWVPRGLKNQGWKDSGNAIVYEDGSQVPNPIALVEFQGYVYDAQLRLAELEEAFGDAERAAALRRQAADLQQRFHERFWMEDAGFFALGIGPEGRLIRSIASNAGHCLWSGIVRPELAGAVVARLMQEDMFSGWGIRTLSCSNPAFNPMDYQLGAVWPHDNAIIALGMKQYGFADEMSRVAQAIFDTATYFSGFRLPELYGGFQRAPHSVPVLYTSANIPQAWAAGSVFQLLQALLGLQADAPGGRLLLRPTLPDWLPDLSIQNLAVGTARIDLAIHRDASGRSQTSARLRQGNLRVLQDGAEIAVDAAAS